MLTTNVKRCLPTDMGVASNDTKRCVFSFKFEYYQNVSPGLCGFSHTSIFQIILNTKTELIHKLSYTCT